MNPRLDIRPRGPLISAEGVRGQESGCGFQGRGGEGGGSEGFEGVGHFFGMCVGCWWMLISMYGKSVS